MADKLELIMSQPDKEASKEPRPESGTSSSDKAGFWLKYIGLFGGIATFLWTAWTYFDTKNREFEVRKVEASKPFLDKQLQLFTEATQLTAQISTCSDLSACQDKVDRFWQLYWGELALVEHGEVSAAMIEFGALLKSGAKGTALQTAALDVAHACRKELAKSWGVKQWNY